MVAPAGAQYFDLLRYVLFQALVSCLLAKGHSIADPS